MNRQTLQQIGGGAFMAGAILLALWTITWSLLLPQAEHGSDFSRIVADPDWIWISTLALFGLIFTLFGATAVFSRICEKTGINGLAGYVFLFLAYLLQFAKVTWEVFVYPVLAESAAPVLRDRLLLNSPGVGIFRICAMISILLGVIIFTIAMIRSRDYSLLSTLLFLGGAVLYGIGPMINIWMAIAGVLIYAAGCILIGLRNIRAGVPVPE